MASFMKFTGENAVRQQLRHIEREIKNNSNLDIDERFSDLNYTLLNDRNMSSYSYFLKRKSELYYRKSKDLVNAVGCIITAPADLDPARHEEFFQHCFEFLNSKFGGGGENCPNAIQCCVHNDESVTQEVGAGQGHAHLHYLFIPVTEDLKHEQGQKINCHDVMTRQMLRDFHPELQHYLDNTMGVNVAKVYTGITKRQGNKTVYQLKQERMQMLQEMQYKNTHTVTF